MASDRLIGHLREMADAARELADEAATAESRTMMSKLAAGYDAMARRLDEDKTGPTSTKF